MSLLVVMGSGETAPAMVKTHRDVFSRSGSGPAAMLDTPFGFQMNADELVARTRTYFAESVGTPVEVARWRRSDEPVVEREQALSLLAQARWVFAGPGSPTYALRQWHGTAVPDAMADVVSRGGTLVLGSAAAVTLGTHAIPVYEIYKVGEDARWIEGLDLLGKLTGIRAAVIPHYDNAEGGSHDTRFCYLGEQRLSALETELPDDVGVLGVDEHTALVLDLDAGTATVSGSGVVTVRRRGDSRTFAAGEQLALTDLAAMLRGDAAGAAAAPATASAQPASTVGAPPSLTRDTDAARERFDTAYEAKDVDGCVQAVLELEQAVHDWSADTLQGEAMSSARRVLRSMVVRLGDIARVGARDPRDIVGPFVDVLLDVRRAAREGKDFATSDRVRDGLTAAGVDVRLAEVAAGVDRAVEDGRQVLVAALHRRVGLGAAGPDLLGVAQPRGHRAGVADDLGEQLAVARHEPTGRPGTRRRAGVADVDVTGDDEDQVAAQTLDLALDLLPGARADRHHQHHGGDADDDAEHGEQAADPVAAQRIQGDAERLEALHARPDRAPVSSSMRPSRTRTWRRARPATSLSWVTSTTATPPPELSSSRMRITSAPLRVSRLPVGSSASRIRGSPTRARAIATRCCSPPDICVGRCVSRWPSPTAVSDSAARSRRSERRTPRYSSGRPTLSSAVWRGSSWNAWNTNPISLLRRSASSPSDRVATSRPPTRSCPPVGRSRQPSRCISVDLPDPLGPTIAAYSPSSMAKLTPRRASTTVSPSW